MRKLLLTATLYLICLSSAHAGWERIGSTFDNTSTAYVDLSRIRHSGSLVDAWVLTDFKTAQRASNGKKFLSIKAKISYDCSNERRKDLSIVVYSGNMGKGELVDAIPDGLGEWKYIVPDTLGEAIAQAVCRN